MRTPILAGHLAADLDAERADVDADSKDNNGRTPLSWAAGNRYKAAARLLAERQDVDADSKDNNGRTPLSWAAERGARLLCGYLLSERM